MFKRTKVCMGVLAALGGALVLTSMPASAQDAERIEITGSRIKRAASEGALPVTVISREQLDTSGATTVAEFVRNTTFAGAGNFRPQSGSSAQAFAGVDLRGLGSNRTLVLLDGRRVAKAPNVGDSVDMNSIPMAAVERIEILTDGASAVYGSDAIGGVVNIITRKDFEGLQLMAGITRPSIKGGDREEASALMGVNSDKGHLIAGLSHAKRGIVYVRDYPWGYTTGQSSYANGMYRAVSDGKGGLTPSLTASNYLGAAGSCNFPDKGFYIDSKNRCRYDFNLVAADEAATSSDSVFARGNVQLTPDWSAYMNTSVTRNKSFGRYAPVPDSILITPGSVFDQNHGNKDATEGEYFLAHRFAAAGNRDTSTDGNLYDLGLGLQGTVAGFDVDVGARRQVSKIVETGRGFIVKNLATSAINDGTYNVDDPFSNSDTVLKSITTTTGRESTWEQNEVYANATKGLFKMDGGEATAYVGVEARKEKYSDIYDSLSEAGQVLGSSGNSATGERTVRAFSTELLFPITKSFEATLAGRYERYSDYGSDFSPKASVRFRATDDLTLRASVGRGFRAPSLPDLNSKPAFSADSIVDLRTCQADGGFSDEECKGEEFQVNGTHLSNPKLDSEKSKQWSMGFVWDITPSLGVTVDYWNTTIDNSIRYVSAQEIVDRDNGDSKLPIPAGLGVVRDPATGAVVQVTSGLFNEGTVKYAGLDVNLRFQHKHAGWGTFRHDLAISHRLKAETSGVNSLGTFGDPRQRVALANTWSIGGVEATLNTNYISKNGDVRGFAGGYTTHDVQVAYSPAAIKGMKISVGAQNIFEKLPQLVGSPYDQKPFNYYLYDAYGRQWYGRLEQKF